MVKWQNYHVCSSSLEWFQIQTFAESFLIKNDISLQKEPSPFAVGLNLQHKRDNIW